MPDSKSEKTISAGRKERFTTLSGVPLDRLYTPENLAPENLERSVGYPGEFPYTRGIYPTMYRGRFWTMRQYAGFASASESNERYRYLLGKGQAGLSVAFDLPTQIGLDSDHPLAQGEIGKGGVAIDSLGESLHLHDHQLDGRHSSLFIRGGGEEAGREPGQTFRHGAKRHFEGIHRAWNVYLSGAVGDAHRDGCFFVVPRPSSQMEYHFHLRLSHS
jgi:hypothetical protein